jgi:hypothetical protein
MAHVQRALSIPKIPAEVKGLIEEMSSEGGVPPTIALQLATSTPIKADQMTKTLKEAIAEKEWDYERVKLCVEHLQMGVDKLLILLPEGRIREMISTVASNVAAYKRRYQFIVAKVCSLSHCLSLSLCLSLSPLSLSLSVSLSLSLSPLSLPLSLSASTSLSLLSLILVL